MRTISEIPVPRVLAASTLFLALGCGGCREPAPVDAVIAEVGGEPVLLSQFESYVRAVSEEDIPLVGGEVKSALLEQLIEELLMLRAAEDEGIEVDPQEIQAMEGGVPPVPVFGPAEDVEAPADWRGRNPLELAAHLKVRKLMDTAILKDVEVTDEEIAAHYEQNRVYYKRPAGVDISQILVGTEEQASQLLAELRSNASRFEELAGQYSIAPEASEGGHMGTFRRGELPTSFESEVFDLKRGALSGVVKTDFGFHIFRVNATYPSEDLSLDEVQASIRVDLLRQKSDDALAIFLENLKQRYPVWIDTEELDFPYSSQNGYDVTPREETEGQAKNAAR
jgi:parvulin-like peptidyl-prolyl isomerase